MLPAANGAKRHPLRILHLSSAQFLGGGERYLADLANALVARGHQVHAVLRPHSPLVDQLVEVDKKNVTTLPLRNALDAQSARRLANLVKNHQIQIIHAHMARDYPLAAYAAARNRQAELIVTRHVLFPLGRLHRLTLGKAARVIAVSEAVAIQLRAERTVPAEKITVVTNGIDTNRFASAAGIFNRKHFLDNWHLPHNALLVGTVGEIKPLKGQEEFLRAAKEVSQRIPDAYFIIAGLDSSRSRENRSRLERLTDELQLRDRVRFVEWLEDIAALHCALDVFVSPSRAESFGLAIAEAMASGTAVVATKTEGAKTIIEDRKTGLLVPIGDARAIEEAVNSLLLDKSERERLGNQARESARTRFGLARMVEATERIYEESLVS